jgi:uncharacterized protein
MYPMNFREFLLAFEEKPLLDYLDNIELYEPIDETLLNKLIEHYRIYALIGGFPAVVKLFLEQNDLMECGYLLDELVQGFRDDFSKYKHRIPQLRIDETFSSIAQQAGAKFKYSTVNPSLPAYQIRDALELLLLAGLAHKIYHTSAQGLPLHSQINEKKFKIIPCDIGLYQRLHHVDMAQHISADRQELVSKGAAAEIITGTELISYASPRKKEMLYYWHREDRKSNAEVDYVTEIDGEIVPIEVKAGSRGKMQSLRIFLDCHSSPYGIRTALENRGVYDRIKVQPACTFFSIFQKP